ncbi:hypothetical protein [Radiobacillus sp. PE A8.2]|uniref:hypothetical protein n=1 Tax=Radiobacillus sp. PE A8.2 TaxID=3380349 RepID=UPI00388F1B1B
MDNWIYAQVTSGSQWIINKSQLSPLGITDQHIYIGLGFLGIVLCYILLLPLLRLLVLLQWDKLLAYISGSLLLLFMICFFETMQAVEFSKELEISYLADTILGIIGFGLILFVIQLVQATASLMKRQNSKSL